MFLRHWLRCIGSTAQMKGTPTTQCQISGTRISTRSTRWGKANMFNHWEKEFRVGRAKILCSWKLVLSVDGWEGARGEVCGPACQLQVFQHGPGEYIHMPTCSKLHWPNPPTFTRRSSMPSSSLTPTFEVCVGADNGIESPSNVVECIWTWH